MRVMITVTHLLGTGHLSRALTLARAFAAAGHNPLVVSGGAPAPHLTAENIAVLQLPPVRSDGVDFTRLLTPEGHVADQPYLKVRRERLVDIARDFAPDVLITELFPFGRRILRDEFEALIASLHGTARLFASVRDILAPPSKPRKATYAEDLITQYYDAVLVHSDPDLIPLDLSWPLTETLAAKLLYTGFVAPEPLAANTATRRGILVSTGGGNVGDTVFQAALDAARNLTHEPWHLVVGGSSERVERFAKEAPAHARVEGLRPDFRELLARSAASISYAGYNTCMDLLQTGTPGVLVPFDAGNEVEQGIRATALAAQQGLAVCPSDGLAGPSLSRALASVLHAPKRPPRLKGMAGAEKTVHLVEAC